MKKLNLFLILCLLSSSSVAFAEEIPQYDPSTRPVEENTVYFDTIFKTFSEKVNLTSIKELFGIVELPRSTVARVNNKFITLRDIEVLADMNYISKDESENMNIESIMAEYSYYLFDLVEQKLIEEEIERNEIPVDYREAEELEEIIRSNYGEYFETELLVEGIILDEWREQLRRGVEKKALQYEITKQVRISNDEILVYHENNQHLFKIPEYYKLIMIVSVDEADLVKALRAKVKTEEEAKKYNVTLQHGGFSFDNIPEEWQNELSYMKVGEFSKIQEGSGAFRYISLVEKIPAYTKSQADAFLQIEQSLIEAKTNRLYKVWLTNAINRANIQIAKQFVSFIESRAKTL